MVLGLGTGRLVGACGGEECREGTVAVALVRPALDPTHTTLEPELPAEFGFTVQDLKDALTLELTVASDPPISHSIGAEGTTCGGNMVSASLSGTLSGNSRVVAVNAGFLTMSLLRGGEVVFVVPAPCSLDFSPAAGGAPSILAGTCDLTRLGLAVQQTVTFSHG